MKVLSTIKAWLIYHEVKDFILGLFVLLLFGMAAILTGLSGVSNPAYNDPPGHYRCANTGDRINCR